MTLHIIVFILSLFGDSIILIGTIKYKAIKQHKVVVAVIQHLAALDILASVFYVLPKTVTLITDRWDLGAFLCSTYSCLWSLYLNSLSSLTLALPLLKLVIVKYPLRTASWSSMIGHRICGALYFFSIILISPSVILTVFFVVGNEFYFSNLQYACARLYRPKVVEIMRYVSIGMSVMNFTAPVAMTALSVALLIIAKRSASRFRESLKWEGVATIVMTVVAYVITNLPYSLNCFHASLKSSSLYQSPHMVRFTAHLLTLNIMSNFFIYCLTIKSFREFLKLRISEILSFARRRSIKPANRTVPTSQTI